MVKREAEAAGLDPQTVTPHVLRHSYATELPDDVLTIREAQELLGHGNVATTRTYTRVRPKDLAAKVQARDEKGEEAAVVSSLVQALEALSTEQRQALAAALLRTGAAA